MSDCISRQAAIDALERKKDKNAKGDIAGFYNKIIQNDIDTLMQLPPAQPERKTARWIPFDERFPWSDYFKCSKCGFRINLRTAKDFGILSVDYCPHCGAKMEVKGNE